MTTNSGILPRINIPAWLSLKTTPTATFDRTYLILGFLMFMIGLIMVASSSMPVAERLFNNPFHFVIRHMIYIVISLGLMIFAL